jgi:hypothetical protein
LQCNSAHHLTPLFWYLGFHGNAILNFINTSKASTHYDEYYYVSWSLMKEINFFFKYSYSSTTHFCPLDFSEMPWSNFMKPCRNIICHVKGWFFQNGCRCHGNGQNAKNSKNTKIIIAGYLDVNVVPIKFYQFLSGK